jgi:hypothetical protein
MTEPSREARRGTGRVGREPIAGGAGVSTAKIAIRVRRIRLQKNGPDTFRELTR